MPKNSYPVPVELMPVAAGLLAICFMAFARAVYLQFSGTPTRLSRSAASSRNKSAPAMYSRYTWHLISLLALAGYTFTVGRIQGAILKHEHSQFDPYAILQISRPGESERNDTDYTTIINAAYRELVKKVHPSNKDTGSRAAFEEAVWAFRSLTEDSAKDQYAKHGHPEGPLLTPVFSLQFPKWLLVWDEEIATSMKLAYACIILGVVGFALGSRRHNETDTDDEIPEEDFAMMQNQVIQEDLQHLAKYMKPDMSHQQVLYLAATAPKMMIHWAKMDLQRIDKLRNERVAQLLAEKSKGQAENTSNAWDALLENDDGWADDSENDENDDDDVATKAARRAAKEKQQQLQESMKKKSTEIHSMLLEGVDDGVLGQAWVQRNLTNANLWPPPDVAALEDMTAIDNPLQDPAISRVLCMLTGRTHSEFLNTHKELLAAAAAGPPPMIDQTYFGANVMFRHRMRLLLEAIIRLASTFHSASLLQTTIESVAMFSVGCQMNEKDKFHSFCMRTVNCVPKLQVHQEEAPLVTTEGESNIVAGDSGTALQFAVERTHAEPMLKAKFMQWQKQGIPIEIALQTFREVWWVIVQAERLGGNVENESKTRWHKRIDRHDPLLAQLEIDDDKLDMFEQRQKNNDRDFLCARPVVVANPKQGAIQGKIMFEAPSEPGEYRFTVSLKSHEFMGCDTEFTVDAIVLSSKEAGREAKAVPMEKEEQQPEEGVEEGDNVGENGSEGKKEK
ncbi:hypothetical protein MPSEU_000042300 [Mayamaea pseudoterrestris]|nr:hypothetical protein MPSEU_000042300 [Mayamaea pseudoterrestris]